MFYFVTFCNRGGDLEGFDTLEKAQKYINDEVEASGPDYFNDGDIEVIHGYYLDVRSSTHFEVRNQPDRFRRVP